MISGCGILFLYTYQKEKGEIPVEYQDSLKKVKGIGEKTEALLNKLELFTVGDLLEHYPRNYDVYEPLVPIAEAEEGKVMAIEGSLTARVSVKKVRSLQIVTAGVRDYSGILNLTWFNMPFLKNTLHIGTKYIFRGSIVRKNGVLLMEQPQMLSKEEFYNRLHILQPVYPLTKGITNNLISKSIKQIFSNLELEKDYLPLKIRKKQDLMEYKAALRVIHFPKNKESMQEARKRIVFDEFFFFSASIQAMKVQKEKERSKYVIQANEKSETLLRQLPYQLTSAQMKVFYEIRKDISSGSVMNRLIQGDVGSGKTILAALSLLDVFSEGHQGALMVPTEVLAKQHYESLLELFAPFEVKVSLLVGSMTAKEKKRVYQEIQNHETDIVIGTHALIQEKVEFVSLALVITDEQHRFGVKQRQALTEKGDSPHVLVMSATPIPRTLAVILYGDLDISIIDELPANRLPIKNCVVGTEYRETAYRFIEKEIREGRQAYVICPMVQESETMEAENVMEYSDKLREILPATVQVEYLHGKMKPKEKNDTMLRFAEGEIQVLVSTTVVEVGINVPNATVMMIENAERFGLSGLHQLRGRVGRGKNQSYCILISGNKSKETKRRLEILNQSNDGFFIAEEDLKLRGPGDLFGVRQSGLLEFKMADVFQDAALLKAASLTAREYAGMGERKLWKNNAYIDTKISKYMGNIPL